MAKGPIKMSVKIDDRDLGMEKFIAEADDDTDSVDIGILADEDEILLIYAASNEFGTRDGRIPERSFIRAGVDEGDARINDMADRLWSQVTDGRLTKKLALAKMGETIQTMVQRKITSLRYPPNAASTIARKKSTNPLIDTGRMRASIRWVLAKSSDGEAGI